MVSSPSTFVLNDEAYDAPDVFDLKQNFSLFSFEISEQ
jgi:hypothetical protein